MEDRFSQPQEGPALHASTLEKKGSVLRSRHRLHDGVGYTLGFRHEANQALVGAQNESVCYALVHCRQLCSLIESLVPGRGRGHGARGSW